MTGEETFDFLLEDNYSALRDACYSAEHYLEELKCMLEYSDSIAYQQTIPYRNGNVTALWTKIAVLLAERDRLQTGKAMYQKEGRQ